MLTFPSDLPLISVSQQEGIFILTLCHKDNRMTESFIKAFHQALDHVEQSKGQALVTTSSHEKIFSNGLDFEDMKRLGKEYFYQFHGLIHRLLTFPKPTVAALSGHAFAGGCMLAFAHDYRVMRSDKGFLCMNEIDLGLPLAPGMMAICRSRISDPFVLQKLVLEGHKFNGEEALALNLVSFIESSNQQVIEKAIQLAKKWAPKAKHSVSGSFSFGAIKTEMHRPILNVLNSKDLGFATIALSKL